MTTPAPASTPWVPMWSLNGGVAIAYLGAWAAGTYQPGQIVVDNGVEYMCVRTTTKRPTGWPGSAATTYGTSLPASPVDGQEAVLVDSLTAPTWQWRFRYNASSTLAYKWEFIGGSPKQIDIQTSEATGAAGWVDLATVGPSFVVPRAGMYICNYSAMCLNAVSASVFIGLTIAAGTPAVLFQAAGMTNNWWVTMSRSNVATTNAAGDELRVRYTSAAGAGASYQARSLSVLPARVS